MEHKKNFFLIFINTDWWLKTFKAVEVLQNRRHIKYLSPSVQPSEKNYDKLAFPRGQRQIFKRFLNLQLSKHEPSPFGTDLDLAGFEFLETLNIYNAFRCTSCVTSVWGCSWCSDSSSCSISTSCETLRVIQPSNCPKVTGIVDSPAQVSVGQRHTFFLQTVHLPDVSVKLR